MQYHYIYKITLLLGELKGHYYFGKRSTDSRRNVLPEEDVDYTGSGIIISKYFKKYGKIPGVTHIKEIIEVNPDKATNSKREREIIGNLYETDPLCSNLIRGGQGGGWYQPGHIVSDETREKLSISHKGKHASEKTRALLSKMRKGEKHPMYGKHHTDEAREKISKKVKDAYNNGFTPWNKGKKGEYSLWEGKTPPMKGKHLSEEAISKIVAVHKGVKRTEEQKQNMREASTVVKPIIATNLCTGETLFFPSTAEASRRLNILRSSVCRVLKGYQNRKQANGYAFKYA